MTDDAPPSRERDRRGEVLPDGVRLGAQIAYGGMGALYRAKTAKAQEIAVKIMHRALLEAPAVRERFLREGRITSDLRHPGIPRVYAVHELPDGTVALEMELLRGETMHQRLERRGYLAPQEVLVVADLVLAVLEAAHAKGVVHRDVKPDNVFLTVEGELKVLDFGIARAREAGFQGLTIAGLALGTPGFMAPEQANGRWHEVDARTDLWALGATMYTALAGEPPSSPAKPIGEVVGGLKKPVRELIDKALAVKRDDRFPDASAMRQAVLDAWRATAGKTSMQEVWTHLRSDIVVANPALASAEIDAAEIAITGTTDAPAPSRRRRIALALAIAAALAAALAIVTYALS
jgi:serine/threonine-protein kinase